MHIPMRPAVLLASVALLATMSVSAAQSPSPDAGQTAGVVHESLGVTTPEPFGGQRLEIARTVLQAGAAMPPTRFAGSWLARVETGVLTVTGIDGDAGPAGVTGNEEDPFEGSPSRLVTAGQSLWFGPDTVMTWENRGAAPLSVLTTAIVDVASDSMVVVDPAAHPDPSPRGTVVKRIVLTGPGMTGDRYRITVADRSGRLIGARVPTQRELRFARVGYPPSDVHDIGIGPVATISPHVSEMLIQWVGTPCGPVVTVDVAQDLGAIRVIDRTPGCDAAGVAYWLVLRFRGAPLDPAGIEGSWIRR